MSEALRGMGDTLLVHHFLEQSAARYPEKIAVIHDAVRASYREVNGLANRLAHFLVGMGVRKGDRVVLMFENSLEYVAGYYGTLKTGAVSVPLSTDLKPDGLKHLLAEIEPTFIISSNRFEKLLYDNASGLPTIKGILLKAPKLKWSSIPFPIHVWGEIIEKGEDAGASGISVSRDDLAAIIYTSGSTGRPKGVMLSHQNIVSNTRSICQYLNLTKDDMQMVVLPFFYVMGKSLLNTHIAVGGTVVINNKFAFPATVLNEMVKEGVTGFSGVPSTYAYLLHRSPLAGYRDKLMTLRYCSQAGGHMPRVIKEGLRQVLPEHTAIYIMYGATEAAARLSYLESERYQDKMDSIGKAIPGVNLRIMDPGGAEVQPGQVGELWAQGPNIMKGYWKDPGATNLVLMDGFYRTGDQAFQDSDGYYYIVGRKDDLIKVKGHRINPREIEDVLMSSGKLVEAAVLGVPDELMGHKLVAFVVAGANEYSQHEILSFCARKLPKHKQPAEIKNIRSLPKNASGKIDRMKCLDLLG